MNQESQLILFFLLNASGLFLFTYRGRVLQTLRNQFKLHTYGEELYRELSLNTPGLGEFRPPDWSRGELQYKFFAQMGKELVELNQKWGGPLKAPWKRLKVDLHQDLQWQKRKQAVQSEAIAQMLLMIFFIWIFGIVLTQIIDTKLSLILILIPFHCLSFFFLFWSAYYLEKKILNECTPFWKTIIRLEVLSEVGISNQEVILGSRAANEFEGEDFELLSLRKALCGLLDSWQVLGGGLREGLFEIRSEFSFIVEQKMQKLQTQLKAIQMGIAALVILPSFFVLFSLSLSRFLIE